MEIHDLRALTRRVGLFVLLLLATAAVPAAEETGAGDPGRNVNLIGPTPDPADIRDTGLKQQNEPACAVRPENPACVICAYNDYRTVEKPTNALGAPIIGDAWQGVSQSCDVGVADRWRSRVAPGHAAHPFPIDAAFAADPRLVALPGMAVFNFIAGRRDSNEGVLAIQHWLETNREDTDPYEPAARTIIADTGTSGRFIDKGELLGLLDNPNQQGQITLQFAMENPDLGTVTRSFPTGDLLAGYAVFTGSNSVKVLVKRSSDWGKTWPNQATKLSEDQNLVSGLSMTAIGNSVLAVWRRAGDNNDPDSIMYAVSGNRGQKFSKAKVLADICRFDQVSFGSGDFVTFRTNDFPWTANDGKNFYVFYSDRNFDGQADCTGGRPRIVMHHSPPGNLAWSAAEPLENPTAANEGLQFMPTAFGARGKVQVAWYDTRRELLPPLGSANPLYRDKLVADYVELDRSSRTAVNRKVDVYTARVTSDSLGDNVQASEPTRVSQYRIAAEADSGAIDGPRVEAEASFANAKLYNSGRYSFLGDYIGMAAPAYRKRADGKWESNASAISDPETELVDFFVAWTDQRDIRGEILPAILDTPVPFGPSGSAGAGGAAAGDKPLSILPEGDDTPRLAGRHSPPDSPRKRSRTTEGVEGSEDFLTGCVPGNPQDRTRDANIYGSLVRDRIRLYAPTPTKPLGGLQRTFPIGLTNRNDVAQTYRLQIVAQPCNDRTICRASWRQLPAGPLFEANVALPDPATELTVSANSTLARTLFFVGATASDQVTVEVFGPECVDGTGPCNPLASITLGGTPTGTAGQLQQPSYAGSAVCASAPDPVACFSNLENELHNPELANPELANPELANPELANPELLNPELANPELLNPELLNPELANLGFANPELANPELANPELLNPELANPELVNPELANPELANPELLNSTLADGISWTDYTYAITNTGNVTTAYNADLAISGTDVDKVDSQLIASTLHIVPTSRNCEYRPQYETQVLATVNNPDAGLDFATIDEPFKGDISALAAPGQTLFFTRRIFGTPQELQNVTVSGFTASSQAANCRENNLDGDAENDYSCETSLLAGQELILLDTAPPTFTGVSDGDVFSFAAEGPDGACADLVGSGAVQATDNGNPVPVICTVAGGIVCDSGNPEGSPFQIPLNTPTDATCTATDDAGNEASVDVVIEVIDLSAPFFLSFPVTPIELDADPVAGTATLNFADQVVAADVNGIDPSPVVLCTAAPGGVPSGGALAPGSYTVTCTATDASGNSDPGNNVSYQVIVSDVTPPMFDDLPLPDVSVPAFDANGAIVTYADPDASDAASVPTVSCSPASGSLFPVGSTPVSCTATDAAGLTASAGFNVIVLDNIAPVISVPGDFTAAIDAAGGATVDYSNEVSVTDNADPSPSLSCTPASGSLFAIGPTTVYCTATDASGNTGTASFIVTVQFGAPFGIDYSKGNIKTGSTVPLQFGWRDGAGNPVDNSSADPVVTARDCATGTIVLSPGEFPGNSDLRYSASDHSWRFNWQTVYTNGTPLPATRQGTQYCLRIISNRTGQFIPLVDFTVITLKD